MWWSQADRWTQRRAIFRLPGLGRVSSSAMRVRRPGQTLAEAALTSMIAIMTVLATLQISLVAAQAFSAMYVAQSTARWLAVRIDTIDSTVQSQAVTFSTGLPGMGNGGFSTSNVTISPSCTALTSGKCASRDSGDAVTVTVTANLSAVMFLPTSFGTGNFIFRLPTTMPAVAYTVLLE